ncbi:MAG: hypothetical protein LBN29_11315 [Mediterranea sp.]|jgi:hypothetical protein|nr:hypothetical protein [Mediterranea sp.]
MTELLIDGVSVVLPKDFTVQVKAENPFFTKNGEYTYDITLPLDNPTNAALYGHLGRMNATNMPRAERPATLISGGRVYCNGVEIITGWTEDSVSIQVASGNSELNYSLSSDTPISELEMREDEVDLDPRYITRLYPEVDYCLATVMNRTTEILHNHWDVYHTEKGEYTYRPSLHQRAGMFPQPYLCAYIREVVKALGYDMVANQLEDTDWKYLYICHVKSTRRWADMLPGWTVKDFLEQVEKMFNAVFVVDARKRTVRLMLANTFYQAANSAHVTAVEDVYEVEMEEDPENETMGRANVRYAFPSTDYYRRRCLPEEVFDKSPKFYIPAIPGDDRLAPYRAQLYFRDNKGWTGRIARTDNYGYMERRFFVGEDEGRGFDMIHEFEPILREGAETTEELEMIPVEMSVQNLPSIEIHEDGSGTREDFPISVPTLDEESADDQATGNGVLQDWLENGSDATTPDASKEPIRLAFFHGCDNLYFTADLSPAKIDRQPISFVEPYLRSGNGSYYWVTPTLDASLRLDKLDERFYQGGYDIDFRRAVKITSHDPNLYDARIIFEIRNKRYVCKEMEFALDADGRKGGWTGTFYPIRISDTEAENRWILADGKWRDGGVWIDNGRWMDG